VVAAPDDLTLNRYATKHDVPALESLLGRQYNTELTQFVIYRGKALETVQDDVLEPVDDQDFFDAITQGL
jgi:hypothetical protein